MLTARQLRKHNFSFGAQGESLAADYLISRHYPVLERNIRVGNHEVDIIAFDTAVNELVFIEVKTRANSSYGDPSRAVTKHKIQSLLQVARSYRHERGYHGALRFDCIAISGTKEQPTIEHFQNITWNR